MTLAAPAHVSRNVTDSMHSGASGRFRIILVQEKLWALKCFIFFIVLRKSDNSKCSTFQHVTRVQVINVLLYFNKKHYGTN